MRTVEPERSQRPAGCHPPHGSGLVIFLEPKVFSAGRVGEVPTSHYTIPIGKAPGSCAKEPMSRSVTYTEMVPVAVKAAERARECVEVIDLRTLFPVGPSGDPPRWRRLAAWSWCRSRRVRRRGHDAEPSSPNEPCTPCGRRSGGSRGSTRHGLNPPSSRSRPHHSSSWPASKR